MKQLLIISYTNPTLNIPSGVRIGKFAKYLPRYNWKPIIVSAPFPYFYDSDKSFTYDDLSIYLTKSLDLAHFFRILTGKKRKSTSMKLRRSNENMIDWIRSLMPVDDKIGWLPFAYGEAKKIIKKKRIRLIFTSLGGVYHQAITARKLSKKFKIPYILEFRDLWADHPFSQRTFYNKILIEHFEKKVIADAARIITVSAGFKKHLLEKYQLPEKKISVITNGFDPEDFEEKTDIKVEKTALNLTFAGSFYRQLNPRDLFRILDEIDTIDIKIKLRFIGNFKSKFLKLTEDYRKKLGKKQIIIELIPRQNYHSMLNYLRIADLLLVFLPEGNIYKNIIPAKTFDYLAIKKPILVFCAQDSDLYRILNEYNCKFWVEPGNIKMGIVVLKKIFDFYKKNKLKECKVDKGFLDQFRRDNLTRKLSDIFNEVTG